MSAAWWLPKLNERGLSQGDVIAPIPFAKPIVPVVKLERVSLKGGRTGWAELEQPGKRDKDHFLYEGKERHAIVVSDSCEIDKDETKGLILIAPVLSLEGVRETDRIAILNQERRSKMPLPEVPGLGPMYADLRGITATNRALLNEERRLSSMSDEGVTRLQVQLLAFFLRLDPKAAESVVKSR